MTLPVAVIAWGWRTALGDDVDRVVDRLIAGGSGAITNPEASYRVRAIAPLVGAPPRSRHDRYVRRLGGFAMAAASTVAQRAQLAPHPRLGLFSAVGGLRAHWDDMLPALARQRDDGRDAWALGLREIHPFWMLRHLSNNVHALLAAELGARGDGATFGGASAGAQAIAAASWALHAGAVDTAIVVAHDSLLEPESLVELGERGAATTAACGDVIAPYHVAARGFVPGEAVAVLVLVRPDAAAAAARLATVTAFAGASEDTADALARAARTVGAAPIVDGAATADAAIDRAERAAVAAVVGPDAVLTALAASFGHVGAATPLVQTIALASALRRAIVPPIAGATAAEDGPLTVALRPIATTARAAIGLAAAAPGLITAIRIEVP